MKHYFIIYTFYIFSGIFLGIRAFPGSPAPVQPAGGESWHCSLFNSYVAGDMASWLSAMLQAEQRLGRSDDDGELFSLALAFYGYTGYLLGTKQKAAARVYLKKLEHYTAVLEKRKYRPSRVLSLQAAARAYHLGLDPARVMTEGPALTKLINRAFKAGPDCPFALAEKGNAAFHSPAVWGGSYTKAAGYYRQALEKLEQDPLWTPCNWYTLFLMSQLALSCEKAGLSAELKKTEEKIGRMAPGFDWRRITGK